MDQYKELRERLRGVAPQQEMTVLQGIVKSVSGSTCDVEIGSLLLPDVRLRASETDDNGEMLIVPKVGTAVIIGSLSGDYSILVVLAVDHVESITINGGKLGGLVNIEDLTKRLNELVKAVNSHTHQGTHGPTGPPLTKAQEFKKTDYEDVTIKH